MIRMLSLSIALASLVALAGFPIPDVERTMIASARHAFVAALPTAANGYAAVIEPAARWRESGSLLALALGLFGAAVVVRRRDAGSASRRDRH